MMRFSRFLRVRQRFPDHRVHDISGTVLHELARSNFARRVRPKARIALGVGSRGISNIATIVRAVVDYWRTNGCEPFIFPAMGSHGAATAEGQAAVLEHFGVDERSMGCPIISSLDVVSLGSTADGIETYLDRHAFESDGVMVIGRVKWHTSFDGKIESGLCKMLAIGAGKFAGAERYHTYGYRLGLEHVIRTVARQVMLSGNILGGLAILEDAYHHTAQLTAVPASEMEKQEEMLLQKAKSWMPRLSMPLDVLIVDEIGKDISGTGMDSKVVNRSANGSNLLPDIPAIERIFVRDLSASTYGNAIGIGMADVVHDRVLPKIDWPATYVNVLTASAPGKAKLPMHFASDCECLERIAGTVGRANGMDVTYGWIRNSLELSELKLSENLRAEIERDPLLEITAPAEELRFNQEGNLVLEGRQERSCSSPPIQEVMD